MINEDEAVRLALAALERDSRGQSFRVFNVVKGSRDWRVVVEVFDRSGRPVIGNIVLVVDGVSGTVRSLAGAIAEGWRP